MAHPALQPLEVEASLIQGHAHAPALDDAAWLNAARAAALARFADGGLPHRRSEAYRYFDLRQMLAKAGPLELLDADLPRDVSGVSGVDDAGQVFAALDRHIAIVVNGRLDLARSSLDALPDGVTVMGFAEAARAGAAWFTQAMHHATQDADAGLDPVTALNLAYATKGVAVHVAAGVRVDKPLEVVWLSTGPASAHYHAHSVISVGDSAALTLLETRGDAASAPLFATLALTAQVGAQALFRHAALYADAKTSVRVGQKSVQINAHARYETLGLAVGAGRARTNEHVHFAGEHAFASLNGLSLLAGTAVMDNTLFVDHAVPNCQSVETYRAVLDEKARGVFQGTIRVREQAQKIDAQMQARALLLSRQAEMNVKPMLEIYADDVVCAHGSAIGEPDEDAIFYLMSRGIGESTARALLVAGFLDDVVDGFDAGAIGGHIKHLLAQRLGAPEDFADAATTMEMGE